MGKWDVYQTTMTMELPSGAPALMAEINDDCTLYVTGSTEDRNLIYVCLMDQDYEYYSDYNHTQEKRAVDQFMSMVKYINPDDFDIEEVAEKYGMELL